MGADNYLYEDVEGKVCQLPCVETRTSAVGVAVVGGAENFRNIRATVMVCRGGDGMHRPWVT